MPDRDSADDIERQLVAIGGKVRRFDNWSVMLASKGRRGVVVICGEWVAPIQKVIRWLNGGLYD